MAFIHFTSKILKRLKTENVCCGAVLPHLKEHNFIFSDGQKFLVQATLTCFFNFCR